MEIPKITDGELNILDVLWQNTDSMAAAEIVKKLQKSIGWNRNTTYTFISRLVEKEVVKREDPGFICTALFSREEIGSSETNTFLQKMFGGSLHIMLSSFLGNSKISKKELADVKRLIEEWEEGENDDNE